LSVAPSAMPIELNSTLRTHELGSGRVKFVVVVGTKESGGSVKEKAREESGRSTEACVRFWVCWCVVQGQGDREPAPLRALCSAATSLASTARDAVLTCRRLTEHHRYVPKVEWPARTFSPPCNLVPALRDLPCNHTIPRRRALGRLRACAAARNGCPWRCVARLELRDRWPAGQLAGD
jgi:hypothetical protein